MAGAAVDGVAAESGTQATAEGTPSAVAPAPNKPGEAVRGVATLDRTRLRAEDSAERVAPNGERYDHRFIASTGLLATDGGVIPPEAWRLERYLRRPRWIANHNIYGYDAKFTEISLGRAVYAAIESGLSVEQVGPSGRALVVYVRYGTLPFQQDVRTLYEDGSLDDVSVRWDYRTADIRSPYEEEVKRFGESLYWMANSVELLELSAVIYGADSAPGQGNGGAQIIRAEVARAMAACRAKGLDLPALQRVIDASARGIDAGAVADALQRLREGLDAQDAWLATGQEIRQQIVDSATAIENLALTDVMKGATDEEGEGDTAEAGEADEEDRSAEPKLARTIADGLAVTVLSADDVTKIVCAAIDAERAVTVAAVKEIIAQGAVAQPEPESVPAEARETTDGESGFVIDVAALSASFAKRRGSGAGAPVAG